MARLIDSDELIKDIKEQYNPHDNNPMVCEIVGDIIYKISSKTNYEINKLAEYEDMEEQGLFIHPPCKLKERLFAIWNEYGHKHIIEVEVKEISIGVYMARKMILIKTEPISKRGRIYKFYGNDFAKVIFHSREKAEQKLKEMEE